VPQQRNSIHRNNNDPTKFQNCNRQDVVESRLPDKQLTRAALREISSKE